MNFNPSGFIFLQITPNYLSTLNKSLLLRVSGYSLIEQEATLDEKILQPL
jgi:hypothetical protein